MAENTFSASRWNTFKQKTVGGTAGKLTFAGTAAVAVVLDRWVCLCDMRVTAATLLAIVGGTSAAGHTVTLAKSLAGTGTASVFGSALFKTTADLAQIALTVTETAFNSGDVLQVGHIAGTPGDTNPIGVMEIAWKDKYTTTQFQ